MTFPADGYDIQEDDVMSRETYDAIFARLGRDLLNCSECGGPAVFDLCQRCLEKEIR